MLTEEEEERKEREAAVKRARVGVSLEEYTMGQIFIAPNGMLEIELPDDGCSISVDEEKNLLTFLLEREKIRQGQR